MKKLIFLFLTVLIVGCSTDDDDNNDNSSDLQKEWLYTHTSLDATATNSTTIVIPLSGDIFAFTDRPNREHKYISGDEFASYWNDYDDENSFKLDPPNAVLTWVDADGVSEVEVVITDADFDGNNVIYTIENTTITANQSFEDVSLFVDGNGSSNNVYLASNGITVKASAGASVDSTGTIYGITYRILDNAGLNFYVSQGEDLSKVCTSLVTNMSSMFVGSDLDFNLSSWDVSSVTNMNSMFNGAVRFFDAGISSWDVSNVTGMESMFANSNLNQDISSWDVSNVTDMEYMFYKNTSFNHNLSSWDVSSVTTMESMFDGATSFNHNLSSWDVSSVTTMEGMFNGASSFNQPIGNWDVSNVTGMEYMFYNNTSFNHNLSSWDVSSVTTMEGMFNFASSFNHNLSSWDVSNVTGMESMFSFAKSFNHNLSSWSVDGVTNCTDFSYGATSWTLPQPNFTNCNP